MRLPRRYEPGTNQLIPSPCRQERQGAAEPSPAELQDGGARRGRAGGCLRKADGHLPGLRLPDHCLHGQKVQGNRELRKEGVWVWVCGCWRIVDLAEWCVGGRGGGGRDLNDLVLNNDGGAGRSTCII